MEIKLKPQKKAFIISRVFLKIFLLFVVMLVIAIILANTIFSATVYLAFFILFSVFVVIIYFLELIVYKKLSYEVKEDKIIQKGGSLFTDYETELNVKNITHLKLMVPFIENKIFGTGHLRIESAGASISEIHFYSMDKYQDLYSAISDLMRHNGFNLEKNDLVMEEAPNALGVFFEVFKSFVVGVLGVAYVLRSISYDDDGEKIDFMYSLIMTNLLPVVGLGIVILFTVHIFKFLDLKKRVYKIYRNVITYNEGFLSKNYSLLPFENLTDSGTTQTLVDKIFSLHDVKISCQGSGQEVLFKNISNGTAMSDTLDKLIEEKDISHVHISEKHTDQKLEDNGVPRPPTTQTDSSDYNYDYTDDLKIDFRRVVKFPLFLALGAFIISILSVGMQVLMSFNTVLFFSAIVFFILTFVFLWGSLVNYIRFRSTKYQVRQKRISYKYSFLTSKDVEFNIDKITAISISKSFIDEWFKNININFISIGASSRLSFASVRDRQNLVQDMVSKIGIKGEDEIKVMRAEFNFIEFVKANILVFALLFFVVAILIVVSIAIIIVPIIIFTVISLIVTLVFLYKREVYKRTKLVYCKSYVYFESGWLFKEFYFAKHKDIKDIKTVKYPFSKEGSITFNIAGETVTKSKQGVVRKTSKFIFPFARDIQKQNDLIDYILYKKPNKDGLENIQENDGFKEMIKTMYKVKPSVKNSVFPVFLILIPIDVLFLFFIVLTMSESVSISLALILFLIFINGLIFVILWLPIYMTTYYVDKYRIIARSGIIYKKQVSIIFDKIDFINNSQGFLNKIFKNGNITVNTIGSSSAELNVKNIPKYKDFYDLLKKAYTRD